MCFLEVGGGQVSVSTYFHTEISRMVVVITIARA